ncbi:hypothetical protein M9458_005072, partial [Cirrhinus mrigala]
NPITEEKPHHSHTLELKREDPVTCSSQPEEEELSGLEFEMKIEQVEELVDQKLNQVQTEQKSENRRDDVNSHSAGATFPNFSRSVCDDGGSNSSVLVRFVLVLSEREFWRFWRRRVRIESSATGTLTRNRRFRGVLSITFKLIVRTQEPIRGPNRSAARTDAAHGRETLPMSAVREDLLQTGQLGQRW